MPHTTLSGGFLALCRLIDVFRAWRLKWSVADLVALRNLRVDAEIPEADDETVEE
jgi:hypothetical protein